MIRQVSHKVRHIIGIMFQIKPIKIKDPNTPGKLIDDYWATAQQKFLPEALDSLMSYDKENIPDTVIAKIEPYLTREDLRC